jgi:diguanylate cyclase (GGDEF)-like protein
MKEYKINFKKKLFTFLLIFIFLSTLIGIILWYFYLQNISKNRLLLEKNEMARIEEQQKIFKTDFDQIISDLFFLAESNTLQNIFENKNNQHLIQLKNDLLIFSEKKGIYDQIHYINQKGNEIIKINYNNGNPYIVSDYNLQNKSQNYYFQQTISLNKGELYLSPFGLNIEKGEIEQPQKPIIKFGTPIFDKKNQKQGIVVLDYLGDIILKRIRSVSDGIFGKIMILNSEGYWIIGQSPDLEWGFVYENKKDMTLEKYDPVAYIKIYKAEQGQFYTKNGLFSFMTIHPFFEYSTAGIGQLRIFSPKKPIEEVKQYFWKIVSFIPSNQLHEMRKNLINDYIKMYFVIFMISGILLLFSVDQYFKRKMALKKIEEYATYDTLTGLLNRRMGLLFLEKELKIANRTNIPFTIGYIDLNNLKIVNDAYGHEEGDFLILTATRLIKEAIRETDILFRLGGDEFIVLLRNCVLKNSEEIWKKVNKQIKEFNSKKNKPYQIALSHGFVQYNPGEKKTVDELITEVDAKMYVEKEKYKKSSNIL